MTSAALTDLRDLHLPPTPWLVQAEAWLAMVALGLLMLVFWWLRRWLGRRSQRAALHELASLARAHARDADASRLARGLSGLLRRYAMARFAESGVAGLTGLAWLEFLDAHGGAGAFSQGVGSVLATRPYQPDGAYDVAALIALVRRWLKANPP